MSEDLLIDKVWLEGALGSSTNLVGPEVTEPEENSGETLAAVLSTLQWGLAECRSMRVAQDSESPRQASAAGDGTALTCLAVANKRRRYGQRSPKPPRRPYRGKVLNSPRRLLAFHQYLVACLFG